MNRIKIITVCLILPLLYVAFIPNVGYAEHKGYQELGYKFVAETNQYIDNSILEQKLRNDVKSELSVFLIEVNIPNNATIDIIRDSNTKLNKVKTILESLGNTNVIVVGVVNKSISNYYLSLFMRK